MTVPPNKGNLITRRSFTDERSEHADRMKELPKLTGRALSTCYQYTEETGLYGSGTPSPLHVVIESVRRLHELDREEGCEISFAQEFAEAPLNFLRQLRSEIQTEGDANRKLNLLMKTVSDSIYMLKARNFKDLTLGELREFAELMIGASALVREIGAVADRYIGAAEERYPGAPMQGERILKSVVSG